MPVYLGHTFNNRSGKDMSSKEERVVGIDSKNRKTRNAPTVKDPFITRNPNLDSRPTSPRIISSTPVLGSSKAPVTIVQFSDFECEYCNQQERILRELKKEYKDKIRLAWKDYPNSDHRSSSWQAAKAVRCAQKQGKFWPYHDVLYQTDKKLSRKTFLELAQKRNLDMGKFRDCLNSDRVNNLIQKDIKEANSLRITGIPFLYINDQEVMGKINKKGLRKIIKVELKD